MISSLDNKTVKQLHKLQQKKYRQDRFLITDPGLIGIARETGYLRKLIWTKERPFPFHDELEVSQEVLDKIAETGGLSYLGVSAMPEEKDDYGKRILLLDRLQDPLNIGRIMEAAQLFGFDSLILSPDCADIYNRKCLDNCKGGIYRLNICHKDLAKEIKKISGSGYRVYATGLKDDTQELHALESAERMAFIMGNEGSGVDPGLMKLADATVKIAMCNIDSLNVGMAASIIMHHFRI